MTAEPPEDKLVAQAVAGDRLSLDRLLLSNVSRLTDYLQPRIPSAFQSVVDVDDIVQQTFFQVFRDIGTFQPRGPGAFFAWLRGIAENRLFDCIREQKRKKRGGEFRRQRTIDQDAGASSLELLNLLSGGNGTPSQSVARRETVHAIQVGIAGLPDDQRIAIELHCIKGLSLEATAEKMGKTSGAVRALVHRGKRKLSEILDLSAIWLEKRE